RRILPSARNSLTVFAYGSTTATGKPLTHIMIEQLEAALAKAKEAALGLSSEYQVFKYDRPQDGMTHSRITLYPLKEFEAPTTQEAIALAIASIESLIAAAAEP